MAEILAQTDRAADAGLMDAIRAERESRTAPPPEEAPQAAAAPEEAPEVEEASESAPGDDKTPKAKAGEADEPAEGAETEAEAEEIELSRMADLIEYVGADEASMYDLTVPITVDGKAMDVPIGQLKDAYRATTEATRMQDEAKAMRAEAAFMAKESQAKYETQLAQQHALVQALERQAMERFQGIDWNELRQSDPAEWSARRTEAQAAQAQIEQVKRDVGQRLTDYQAQMKEQQAAAYDEHLMRERAALHSVWPELADPEKGKEERSALIEELKTRGFMDEEIGNAADHRLLLMARDAMRYRQSAKKVDTARKKVVKIQKKVLQPGAASAKADRGHDAINKAAQNLKKTGHHRDFAAWLGEVRRRS